MILNNPLVLRPPPPEEPVVDPKDTDERIFEHILSSPITHQKGADTLPPDKLTEVVILSDESKSPIRVDETTTQKPDTPIGSPLPDINMFKDGE